MDTIERRVQAFTEVDLAKLEIKEPEFTNILLSWATKQPNSDRGFLDLAAGQGLEANVLSQVGGYKVIAQDASAQMAQSSIYPDINILESHRLDYHDNTFSGILLKDALLFLSPFQREQTLWEAFRVLVSGGSLLIKSEASDANRARYIPRGSKIVQCLSSFDFKSYAHWIEGVHFLENSGDEVFLIEYICNVKDIRQLGIKTGFECKVLIEYDRNNLLSTQSRWVNKNGFIIELYKPDN